MIVLFVWLALAPAPPQKLVFGPFTSQAQCEQAYETAHSHYIGTVPLEHVCVVQETKQ